MSTPLTDQPQESAKQDSLISNIHKYLVAGVENRATSIFLYPGAAITYRVGNKLLKVPETQVTAQQTRALLESLMPDSLAAAHGFETKAQLLKQAKSTGFSYSIQGVARFRVHAFMQRGSYALSIRVIPREIPDIRTFDLPQDLFTEIRDSRGGLFIVCGKTRSGKSSLLASIVDHINRTMSRVLLILEPAIQYSHKSQLSLITQRETGFDVETLAVGVEDAFRQDQDILVVDELADPATFERVMEAVVKGVTVLAAMGTPDAEKTIQQLLSFRPFNRQMELINDLMTYLRAVTGVSLTTGPEGVVPKASYCHANILNGMLLSRRNEMENKSSAHAAMAELDNRSSVDQSWFDTE